MGQYTTLPIPNQSFTSYSNLVFLSDFGVVGNGAADDTAALNAAFASLAGKQGTIIWNVGFCKVTSTIIVGQLTGSGATSFINIICPNGQIQSGIHWAGPTNGTAMAFCKNKYFYVRGLGIHNTVAKGTTVGLVLGGDGAGFGTATLGGIFENCFVRSFNTGIIAGGNSGAASEIRFASQQFDDCNLGFDITDFNSLDFVFEMLELSGNGVGLSTGAASGFSVFGGSASFSSTADFKIGQNSANTYIGGNFRSENAGAVLLGDGSGGAVTMEQVLQVSAEAPNFYAVTGNFSHLVVRDCALDGFISPSSAAWMEISGNGLNRWDTTRALPVLWPAATTDQVLTSIVDLKGNLDFGAFPQRQIDDHRGLLGARSTGAVSLPFYEPVITVIPIDHSSATDPGFSYLALSHVRHLAEGTIPGATAATAPATGKNLRVQGTFATSNSLAFTFKRTLTTTATSIPLVTATAGTFKPTDVGKPMKIALGADTGADWYGYITEYLSPTTVNVFPSTASPGQRYPQGAGKTCTVGADEPDTNYFVAGLVGNANETFWVDTIATTGFTLHSSNASSTATVTALIVR